MEALIRSEGLHKAYAVPVLKDFAFTLRSGEVHALVGSNGAGKSTFAKILCGLTQPNRGTLYLSGDPFAPRTRQEAATAGIVMVMQELNLLPTLSIAENLFLDRLPRLFGCIRKAELHRLAGAALEAVNLGELDPDLPTGRLGVGKQQLVEIASALARQCRVLILDEPTAALTDPEIEELFRHVRRLRESGVGILYISHRMDEIRRIADRVTVLRDGRCIATHQARDLDLDQVIREMAGKTLVSTRPQQRSLEDHPTLLEVRDLMAPPAVHGVSFSVKSGEILGIAGLVGSGRTELLRALFGADRHLSGQIRVAGSPVTIRDPSDAVAAGIGMIPEDRKGQGLLLERSVLLNATLNTLQAESRAGIINRKHQLAAVEQGCRDLEVQLNRLGQPIASLSGGNQQKVILIRWLLRGCRILLLDEPTRGIDIAAKEMIYGLLRSLACEGKALVMVSSELVELMALCDRIVVLSAGRLTGTFTPETWSTALLTEAAFSGYRDAS